MAVELYGQRVQSTVNTEYLPFVVDTTLNSNVLFQRVVRAAKDWKKSAGRSLRIPIKVSKNTNGGSFRGMDTFSVTATDNRQVLEFTPAFYEIPCVLPGDELSVADSDAKILDLMRLTMQSDAEDMADDLGTIIYSDGTGNSSKDPLGLAAIVDDGTAVATIGGLSRTTYATLKSTVTASGGTLTLAKMDTLRSAITSGMQKPSVYYTTENVWNLYGQLLRPQERINKQVGKVKGMRGGTGFDGLDFGGSDVVADEKCTTGAFIGLNEDFVDFYGLPFHGTQAIAYKSQIKGNDYNTTLGLGFSWSGWIVPENAGAVIGHIYFGGQLVTSNPKRHGKLTGITGV